ncbi:MAG: hypothetical protein ACOYBY_19415 [Dermatophilaceae bacterium]
MLVIDACVLAVALIDDGQDGDAARHRLRGERLAAPSARIHRTPLGDRSREL